jgi:hypothetical protein
MIQNGWAVFDVRATKSSLQNFLETYKPSISNRNLHWICVRGPQEIMELDTNINQMLAEWKTISKQPVITHEDIHPLAIKYNCRCGKWMIFCKTEEVENIWSRIASAVVSGNQMYCSADISRKSRFLCKGESR